MGRALRAAKSASEQNHNQSKHNDLDNNEDPQLAGVGIGHNLFEFVVNLNHLLVGSVHVDVKTVKHFVLGLDFSLEVLVLVLDVLEYPTQLVQLLILVPYHLPLLLHQLLVIHILGVVELTGRGVSLSTLGTTALEVKQVYATLDS